jgi:hypothetical protein
MFPCYISFYKLRNFLRKKKCEEFLPTVVSFYQLINKNKFHQLVVIEIGFRILRGILNPSHYLIQNHPNKMGKVVGYVLYSLHE